MTGWWVASLCPTTSTTQPLQTELSETTLDKGVSAGISGHSILGFWSLRALARLNDRFWRLVSASKNSVPGGRD